MEERDTLTTKNGAAERVRERVGRVGARAGEYFDQATSAVGRGLEHGAESLATRSEGATGRLSRSGRYLQDSDARRIGTDLTEVMRNHPIASLTIGIGLGFWIGRLLSR